MFELEYINENCEVISKSFDTFKELVIYCVLEDIDESNLILIKNGYFEGEFEDTEECDYEDYEEPEEAAKGVEVRELDKIMDEFLDFLEEHKLAK